MIEAQKVFMACKKKEKKEVKVKKWVSFLLLLLF